MNFAETAVEDHSAEQSPSPAGPYPQQDSHSLALGHRSRQFPWSRSGPQTSSPVQHWGEVKLQWHSSNPSRVSPVLRIWLTLVFSAIPQTSPQSRPFYGWQSPKTQEQGCSLRAAGAAAGIKGKNRITISVWRELMAGWHSGNLAKQRQFPCTPPWVVLFQLLPCSSQTCNLLLLLFQTLQSPSLNSA